MPELPDLQAFSGNLNKALAGKTLKKVTVVNDKKLKVPVDELRESLEGQKLSKIERIGKELHFEFDNGNVLGFHLMLNGELHLFEKKNDKKNTIIELLFEDEKGLVMTDFQGMATPTLNPEERDAPDALSGDVTFDFLKNKLQKKTVIKTVLLDQNVIRGIGNAYADEILWEARIHPSSASNKIPDNKIKDLVKCIKDELNNAIKQILKAKPDIITGEVREFLKIHNPRKKESPTGSSIKVIMIGGRKTYYTDEQELYK